jgi:hypothetical protein
MPLVVVVLVTPVVVLVMLVVVLIVLIVLIVLFVLFVLVVLVVLISGLRLLASFLILRQLTGRLYPQASAGCLGRLKVKKHMIL